MVEPLGSVQELERSLEEDPSQTALWLRYAKHWEHADEVNALAVYNDAVRRCPHVELWKQYLAYCKKCVTVKGVLSIFQAAVDVVAHDHRAGPLYLEFLALLKAVWNYQWQYKDELILDENLELTPAAAKQEEELATKCGGNLPLSKDEEEAIKWIAKKAPSDSFISVKTRLTLEQIRRLYRQACHTPTGVSQKLVGGYELLEDHLSGTKNVLSNAPDRDGAVREFYQKISLAKQVSDKLNKLYAPLQDTLLLPQPEVSTLSKSLPKASTLVRWAEITNACWNILNYERTNPLKLPVGEYQARLTFLYQNVLLLCGNFSEFWYSFFAFLYTFTPVKALQVLKIGSEKLPNDLFLRLSYVATFEELVYKKNFNAVLLGNVMHPGATSSSGGAAEHQEDPQSLHEAIGNMESMQEYADLMQDMDLMAHEAHEDGTSAGMAFDGLGTESKDAAAAEAAEGAMADVEATDGGTTTGTAAATSAGVSAPTSSPAGAGRPRRRKLSKHDLAEERAKKYKLVFSLYEQCVKEFDGEQYALAIIHFLSFIRRQGGANTWREYFLKKVLVENHAKMTWEVYASQALVEYHSFGEKERCAQIYKIGLDRFRTADSWEPSLVASFVNFLISVNDLPAARDELTLAIQKSYHLLRELHSRADSKSHTKDQRVIKEKQKLQTGFKFLFEKLRSGPAMVLKLEQNYGEETVGKVLGVKNRFLLESVPEIGMISVDSDLHKHLFELPWVGSRNPKSGRHHIEDEMASVAGFLNDTLTTMLGVLPSEEGQDEEPAPWQQPRKGKGKGKSGRDQPGGTIARFDGMKDPNFHSDKVGEKTYHLDYDYNKPGFLRANLLSSTLQPGNSSFLSCSAVLPFQEAIARFKFQHLAPATNRLNPSAAKSLKRMEQAEKQARQQERQRSGSADKDHGTKYHGTNSKASSVNPSGAQAKKQAKNTSSSNATGDDQGEGEDGTTNDPAGGAGATEEDPDVLLSGNLLGEGETENEAGGAKNEDEVALMVKQRMAAQFDGDSDDDVMGTENLIDDLDMPGMEGSGEQVQSRMPSGGRGGHRGRNHRNNDAADGGEQQEDVFFFNKSMRKGAHFVYNQQQKAKAEKEMKEGGNGNGKATHGFGSTGAANSGGAGGGNMFSGLHARKAAVIRPDTARMNTFNPVNAVYGKSADNSASGIGINAMNGLGNNNGGNTVTNILPKVLLDLQQMLPGQKVLKGSAPDVDYLMSVLQTVELPTIPIEQFSKHDDTSVLNRKDASGIGGGGMLFGGGGRLTSLDDNMSLMASVGGSVHNFQIDGAVDESRYRLRGQSGSGGQVSGGAIGGAGGANGNQFGGREQHRGRVKKGGHHAAKKEEFFEEQEADGKSGAALSAMRERINVKRRKVHDIVKAEEGV